MPVNPFKWKHYEGEIILLNVRWYLKYALSYRNLEEMMAERGVEVDHTTIMRWVHQYSPEIEKKIRKHLRPTNDSWRVDETYIRVKGEWKYLYRAVDSDGNTIPKNVGLRQIKYLNNIIEQDHRPIKRIVRPMLGFQSFHTATKTLKGIEIMHMIKKGQVDTLNRCVLNEVNFINQLFGIPA
jgi:transposase-like protein